MPRRVRIRMACIAIVVIVMASLAANEYVLVHVATLSKSMARLFNPVAVDEGVDEGLHMLSWNTCNAAAVSCGHSPGQSRLPSVSCKPAQLLSKAGQSTVGQLLSKPIKCNVWVRISRTRQTCCLGAPAEACCPATLR